MTKKQIVFASTNQGKINELRKALPDYEVLSLSDFPNAVDVDEPFLTFVENAEHKARSFAEQTGIPVLAEDSGVIISHLTNENRIPFQNVFMPLPGVISARYASIALNNAALDHDFDANNEVVMLMMKGAKDRSALFISQFVYYDGEAFKHAKGIMKGEITNGEPKGDNGFAYDTIFKPIIDNKVSEVTYAEMTDEQKLEISHRVKGLKSIVSQL